MPKKRKKESYICISTEVPHSTAPHSTPYNTYNTTCNTPYTIQLHIQRTYLRNRFTEVAMFCEHHSRLEGRGKVPHEPRVVYVFLNGAFVTRVKEDGCAGLAPRVVVVAAVPL